jgi:predicted transcriptional regulator
MRKPVVTGRHQAVLDVIEDRPSTADEVADVLGRSVLYVRPTFSELVSAGLIIKSGERRPNISGKLAAVWRLRKTTDNKAH